MTRLLAAALVTSALAVTGIPAGAADFPQSLPVKAVAAPPPASGWTFHFTPYLWAAGLKGDVGLTPLAPPVNVDVGFIDILEHLKMTFMGTFEARNGRVGWIADISYLAVEADGTGPLGFVNAELTSKTFFGTFAGAYRVSEQASGWFDIVGGARVWWLRNELDITAPGPTQASFAKEKSWVDPIVGFRARANLSPQFFAQVYADVGGFGVGAKLDWQVVGILGYQYSPTTSFFGGYRYLAVDYNSGGFIFDVNMHGPIFGASFKF
jgi:hypothetical protein